MSTHLLFFLILKIFQNHIIMGIFDLGVTISKDLSWNTHINNITSTPNKTLGFVKRNVVTKNKDIKTMAYNSLVRPQVEYASVVWSPYTKDNINKIEKVQRRAARWVTNDYSSYSSVTDIYAEQPWMAIPRKQTYRHAPHHVL